jgi:hypothetical protein
MLFGLFIKEEKAEMEKNNKNTYRKKLGECINS